MDAIKKAERRKAMGETKKVPVRIDPKQWERLDEIRKKFKFKSNYEIMQYILSCFLRVADPDNDTEIEPVPEEIEMMFSDLSDSERYFEYVKPKRSMNHDSLNSSKHNLKSN